MTNVICDFEKKITILFYGFLWLQKQGNFLLSQPIQHFLFEFRTVRGIMHRIVVRLLGKCRNMSFQIQGVLIWTVIFWEAINDRNRKVEWDVMVVLKSWDLEIYVNVRQISLTQTVSEIWLILFKRHGSKLPKCSNCTT